MTIDVRHYTDPACPWSWGAEPILQRLRWEFGDEVRVRPVMCGLARTFEPQRRAELIAEWLEASERTGMPVDALLWRYNPLSSSYPVSQAVKAAREQGPEAERGYLRRVREGILFGRRRLDHAEPLAAEAGPAGLDPDRFEIDLRSHAIVEAFAADLDECRNPPPQAHEAGRVERLADGERIRTPTLAFAGATEGAIFVAPDAYEACRAAAVAAGAEPPSERLAEPVEALERFGRLATRELAELTGRPRPVLEAELWALAREWRVRAETRGTGTVWELA